MKKGEEFQAELIFDDPKQIDGPYLSFKDANGKTKYTPTTEEMFHKVRNIRRDCERREQKGIYYDVLYEDRGWVRQSKKPSDNDEYLDYKVVGPASLDYLKDEYDLEFSAEEETSRYGVSSEEINKVLSNVLAKLSPIERKIFELGYLEEKNDTEIAVLVFNDKKKRTSVCRQREEVRYYIACQLKVKLGIKQ